MDLADLLLQPQKAMRRFSPLNDSLTEGQAHELAFLFNRVREGEHRARIVGERGFASADPVVRAVYAKDAYVPPKDLDMLIKRRPGAVVFARSKGELLELLKFAKANNVPLTPRGGGTSMHQGSIPTEAGVVVDMRGLDKVLDVDADKGTVKVQAGANVLDIEERLGEDGLALCSYPEHAPFGTIGGYVAMGGGGFGSYQYGPVRDQLVEATLLTPDGVVETLSGEDLDLVEGAHGITGFILDVTLKVREATTIKAAGAAFETAEAAAAYVNALGDADVFSLHILGPQYVDLKQEAAGARQLPKGRFTVLTALHDRTAGAATERLERLCEDNGGEWVKPAAAQWEWDNRFVIRSYKRFGPSTVTAHAVSGFARLGEAWKAGERAIKAPEFALWGLAISPHEVLLTADVLADERLPSYPLASGNGISFMYAVRGKGGRIYAPGILHAFFAKEVYGKARLKRLKKWKKAHDKKQIMNPGKVFEARIKGTVVAPIGAALGPGTPILRSMRGSFDHRRGSTTEPSNRALARVYGRRLSTRLALVADDLYKCSGLGHTNRVGALHREPRFDTQLPRGIVRAGQALLQGAEPGEELASHALSLPAVPTYEGASQNGVPILAAIEAVREAAQAARALDPRVKALVEAVEANGNVHGKPKGERGDWLPGGSPSGTDTSTLLVAGDTAAHLRDKDAAAAFGVLSNTGFSFTTLGAGEPHPGTTLYRLGAVAAARANMLELADAAEKKLKGRLPATLVTLSSEDADVLRRRLTMLVAEGPDSERAWSPTVLSFSEACAELLSDGRLQFASRDSEGVEEADADDDAGAPDEADADAEATAEEEEEEEEPGEEDEAAEASAEGALDEAAPAAEAEGEAVTLVHSPFATEAERAALAQVAEALPGVTVAQLDGEVFLPDLAFTLTHPELAKTYVERVKPRIEGKALVGCADLAQVLSLAKVEVVALPQLVAERMVMRDGGGVVAATEDEEEGGFKEHDIPDGAFRVELVKQNAAIPVHPDESILDAAEALGYEMPFDCRAGSCVTCCAKWEGAAPDQSEGQVLSGDEQKTYVLTCIAKPKGPVKIWSNEQP